MPEHNTKGKSVAAKKRYAKKSTSPDTAKYASSVARLRRFVTGNFHTNHVALTNNPNFASKLGNASRPIDNSTCLILTPADLARFESMISAQRKKIVKSSARDDRSIIYKGEKIFKMMVWSSAGKGKIINGTFSYSYLRDGKTWYVHHLESTQAEISHVVESDSDSEGDLYFSSDEGDSDDGYESDW